MVPEEDTIELTTGETLCPPNRWLGRKAGADVRTSVKAAIHLRAPDVSVLGVLSYLEGYEVDGEEQSNSLYFSLHLESREFRTLWAAALNQTIPRAALV